MYIIFYCKVCLHFNIELIPFY